MDIRDVLKGQYHAAYRMLRECVEVCPEELWLSGAPPRQYWKIAYHAAFYGHLYMGQNESACQPLAKHSRAAVVLWDDERVDPVEPFSEAEILDYIDQVRTQIEATIDGLDLDSPDCGFPWYKNISKLEHEILGIRHLQGHVGQLSERLMAAGIDTTWIARRA